MNRKINHIELTVWSFFIASVLGCSNPTETEEAWDWYSIPTLEFLTEDWRFSASHYSAGDSLSIALIGFTGHLNPNQMGLLVSASGDSEEVNFFKDQVPIPYPFGLPAIYTCAPEKLRLP